MNTTAQPARALPDAALNQIFREARTHSAWLQAPVPEADLRQLYELLKWAPTSANGSPGRFVFLTTEAAKARLLPAMMPGNLEKTKAAPVVAIVAMDMAFYDKMPVLFPQMDMRGYFSGNPALSEETAFRNSSLEGGYFILAARALGLDCGPMSGFDAAKVNAEFFPDGQWKVNFICNLGHGDAAKLFPRNPRLAFEDACRVL